MAKVEIDPVTRLEGHYAVKIEVEGGRVTSAQSVGEMFRGFEVLLRGRDPLDAQQITQRICGVCPISHGYASILAQDAAYRIKPPTNGRIMRNLILGANYLQSHLVHFYQLSALDFIDVTAVLKYQGSDPALTELKAWVKAETSSRALFPAAPFLPRYAGAYATDLELNVGALKHYLEALEMRAAAHKMVALFAGKVPHAATLVPGGVTERPTASNIIAYGELLKRLAGFVETAYLPDVLAVSQAFPQYYNLGRTGGQFLAYGVFPQEDAGGSPLFPGGVLGPGGLAPLAPEKITEQVKFSWFKSATNLHPSQGQTVADPAKAGAYSWLKAPRYAGQACEVGPTARLLVAVAAKEQPAVTKTVEAVLAKAGRKLADLNSVLGRHLARAIEAKVLVETMTAWLDQLHPQEPACVDFKLPESAQGMGLVEAPRGALGHWLEIKGGRIGNYQCVVPSTWNCSPRDDQGQPGPVEQALMGTPIADQNNPLEAARVVRSFDPCLACAVH